MKSKQAPVVIEIIKYEISMGHCRCRCQNPQQSENKQLSNNPDIPWAGRDKNYFFFPLQINDVRTSFGLLIHIQQLINSEQTSLQ